MRDLSASEFDWDGEAAASFEAASLIDRHSAFDGNFQSQKDLRIEGDVKGTISCDGTLFVAEGATVAATVEAEHISVAGDLTGEVRCRGRLQIMPSGRVRASVSTATLVIQEGAIYEGQLEMAGIERMTPRPLRARQGGPAPAVDVAATERASGTSMTFIRRLGSPEAPWEGPGNGAEGGDDAPGDPAG
ncbi:MAG: polymer-forming cytoskeletal protein [Thermomicrobiales bacterium]|nr:polymer-forming cytoskeletal protein [Thermomicrobiales bacterium]